MQRRHFLQRSAAGAAAIALGSPTVFGRVFPAREDPFNLNYAPHLGMFKHLAGEDPIDQLHFMADQGFRAFEDNGLKGRPIPLLEKMLATMVERELEMGVFVAHKIYWDQPNLTSGKPEWREEFLGHIEDSITYAKLMGATCMTVVPGQVDLGLEMGYQTANVVESLRRACDILEPYGLVMVLEPLNWWTNHPGQFLTSIPQAYEICRAVDSPSCKILFDIYHQQITEGNIINNMDKAWEEIAYFQVGDVPGRKEPTTGEINYLKVFEHLHKKGYEGIIGMEHGNSRAGKEGERAVIEAYRRVDAFL